MDSFVGVLLEIIKRSHNMANMMGDDLVPQTKSLLSEKLVTEYLSSIGIIIKDIYVNTHLIIIVSYTKDGEDRSGNLYGFSFFFKNDTFQRLYTLNKLINY